MNNRKRRRRQNVLRLFLLRGKQVACASVLHLKSGSERISIVGTNAFKCAFSINSCHQRLQEFRAGAIKIDEILCGREPVIVDKGGTGGNANALFRPISEQIEKLSSLFLNEATHTIRAMGRNMGKIHDCVRFCASSCLPCPPWRKGNASTRFFAMNRITQSNTAPNAAKT